jgi:tetratricopeptide (TPR) repeat protein
MALYYRGGVFFDNGEYDNTIRDLTVVLNYDPNSAKAFNDRASAKRMLDDLDGALADYDKAISIDGNSPFIYNNRGSVKRIMEDFNGAIKDAIELLPSYISIIGDNQRKPVIIPVQVSCIDKLAVEEG